MNPISLCYVVCRDHSSGGLPFHQVFGIICSVGEQFNHVDTKIAKVKLTEFVFLCVRENKGRTEHAGHSKVVFDVRNIFDLFNGGGEGSDGTGVDSLEIVSGLMNTLNLTRFGTDFD